MNPTRLFFASIAAPLALALFSSGACAPGHSSQDSDVEEEEATCRPPNVMMVVDASASMLDTIDEGDAVITKWQALGSAVHTLLAVHGNGARYGLTTFPGPEGGCAAGAVQIDIGLQNRDAIDAKIGELAIAPDASTPAGQTLMALAKNESLLDSDNENYVIFVSDGWQFCSIASDGGAPSCAAPPDCEAMGIGECPSCNACQISSENTACTGQNADGCYCVRNWPVLGVEALKAAGIKTYVVGFGDKVDAYTLNQAAVAGGDPLPDCDPNSEEASCFLQATSPAQLTEVLSKIMIRLTTAPCKGGCGIEGTRSCTLEGWTECSAPDTVACQGACGAEGVQSCVDGELGECSAVCETTTGGGGAGGAGGAASSSTASSTSSTATSSASSTSSTSTTSSTSSTSTSSSTTSSTSSSGSGGSGGAGASSPSSGSGTDPWDDGDDYGDDYGDYGDEEEPASSQSGPVVDPNAESGCQLGGPSSSPSGALWMLASLLVLGARRRRARS